MSLNKLAYLATLPKGQLDAPEIVERLEGFNRVMDMIYLQEALFDHFDHVIKTSATKKHKNQPDLTTVQGQSQWITKRCYAHLEKQKGFESIMHRCTLVVLKKQVLTLVEMVELLTLCGSEERAEWFDNALVLVNRLKDQLTEKDFETTLATLWRRAWLHTK
jgi:hypothetical protein